MNKVAHKIAESLDKMHAGDNIHGDLTTSNMMIKPNIPLQNLFAGNNKPLSAKEIIATGDIGQLYLIDFGLSFMSAKIEDKAVDIYVLKRALISTHPGSEVLWDMILNIYKDLVVKSHGQNKGLQIVAKYKDVELRGRKRECFG